MASTSNPALQNDSARIKQRAIYAAIQILTAAGVPATMTPYYGSVDMNRIIVLPGVFILDQKDNNNGGNRQSV